jgi:hypothetical protein
MPLIIDWIVGRLPKGFRMTSVKPTTARTAKAKRFPSISLCQLVGLAMRTCPATDILGEVIDPGSHATTIIADHPG